MPESKHGQPHRTETLKRSQDPLFIEKVRDIVGLYLNPPDKDLVLCVDEMAQIQALDRTRPLLPMRPRQMERRTHDYRRHGTTSLFAALNMKTGRVIGQLHHRQRTREFRKFLDTIEANVPAQLDVHLILDNYRDAQNGSDQALAPQATALPSPLHADQRVLAQYGGALARAVDRESIAAWGASQYPGAQAAIRAYIAHTDAQPQPFVWTKTADEILTTVASFCHQTSDSGH